MTWSPAGTSTVAGQVQEPTAQPLSTVIPGLDPGIQESDYRKQFSCDKSTPAARLCETNSACPELRAVSTPLDCRVKPCNDDLQEWASGDVEPGAVSSRVTETMR